MTVPSPVIVVALIGLPGAGKSAVAEALQSRLGLHRICRDRIRQAMFPRCDYTPAEKRAARRALLTALEVNCALGRHSVLDGMTFSRRSDLQAVDAAVAGYAARCLPIFLDCPPDIARQRIAADATHPAADRTPELVDQVQRRFDPPPPGCVVVDARQPEPAVIEAVVGFVEQQLRADA